MQMNSNSYKQYDTRWSTLGYPRKPWYIRNCGCGEVAVCNAIIEMATQQSQTPKTIQPYMVQFAESRGNGTYHYGIPRAMAHYGMTEVWEHSTMQKLFTELAKGDRVAILLMGKRSAGSKGVHWTGSGHFISVVQYKKQGNKNWLYVKDSASTSSLRNGWITYEDNIKGACLKCWSGKLAGKKATTTNTGTTNNGKLVVDGIGGTDTVNKLQAFLGVKQTGGITIKKDLHKYCPALKAVEYGSAGSATVKYLQKWLGITQDGQWGAGTSKALQKKLGVAQDGIAGSDTMKALQKYLNENSKAVYPSAPVKSPAKTVQDKVCDYARKIANDNSYKYVAQTKSDSPANHCAICKGYTGKYKGFNCIRFVGACFYHSGVKIKSADHKLVTTDFANRMLKATPANALKLWTDRNGGKWQIVKNGNKKIPQSMLKKGDVLICYDKEGSSACYKHMALYMGDGNICDATSGNGIAVRKYSSLGVKTLIAMRYVG